MARNKKNNYFVENLRRSKGWYFWNKFQPPNISYAMGEFIYTSFDFPAQMINISIASGKNNVSNSPRKVKNCKIHPSQKPVELYGYLMQRHCKQGDNIIDTHLGSGTSRVAAYKLGLDFTGYEINKENFENSIKLFEKKKGIVRIENKVYTQMEIFN